MTLKDIKGRVAWIFQEDNFDVDQIVGVKNIKLTDIEELTHLAMRSYDPQFANLVHPGDLIVGGRNFGYGHPHYPPMKVMRHLGIQAVIAESFSPGFWRGEISMGFPLVSCPGILKNVNRWDQLSIAWKPGLVRNETVGSELRLQPLSMADHKMLQYGGLIPYLKASMAAEAKS
jgi:3-isopropylmalate/(R)-2-methylmalate dehydratase small subunit